MEFAIKKGKKGEVILEGDPDFFFWLVTAAGNARAGREGNTCDTTDGKASVRLQPTNPILSRPDASKRGIAEVAIRHGARQTAE